MIPTEAITLVGDEVTVDAEILAPGLQLSVPELREAMARGEVRTLVERGEDEDHGRLRLTFRYAERQFSIMVEPDGQLHETAPPPAGKRPVRASIMKLLE